MQRVLIDFDFDAAGIWLIPSSEQGLRPVDATDDARLLGSRIGGSEGERPWSNLLTTSLLDELIEWNQRGCRMARSSTDNLSAGSGWDSFYVAAKELASQTQLELGARWDVLWAEGGAWHFVRPPWESNSSN